MGGPVLVGLDGTENSRSAVRRGAAEVAAQGLPLHLLHSWASPQPLGIPIAHEAASRRRYGAEVLDRAKTMVRELHPGLAVTTEQVSEDAVDARVDRGRQATVTVLGSVWHVRHIADRQVCACRSRSQLPDTFSRSGVAERSPSTLRLVLRREAAARQQPRRRSPAGALVEASARADLLVVGAHRPGRPPGARLGRITHADSQHAHCPVAVVPHR
ncbi:universal stress protein [Streptomyces sp. NPDC001339]|uniref:universal stress protein n=1 Tax=Streptomyces sp. NPDC001339 TaxID=3364563 RepID=UPI0036A1DABD